MTNPSQIIYRIQRFDPEKNERPYVADYSIPLQEGMTVLDGLMTIKETQSPTLSWRYSCRMGICGSCGMLINGLPRLACNTQVAELGSKIVAVAPLPNFDIIRDLVPDLKPMFDAHGALSPHIIRQDFSEIENPSGEFSQTPEQLEQYLQFSHCIKCGCCMAACPTVASDTEYSGPMPLAQAHRYNADNRDDGFKTRKQQLAGGRGPWRCHFAGECSRVCPKGVDPARAIQLMKRALVLDYLRLRKEKCPAKLAEIPDGVKRRPDVPPAPEPTCPSSSRDENARAFPRSKTS